MLKLLPLSPQKRPKNLLLRKNPNRKKLKRNLNQPEVEVDPKVPLEAKRRRVLKRSEHGSSSNWQLQEGTLGYNKMRDNFKTIFNLEYVCVAKYCAGLL
uniref:Uncharacterized protein n=1 Tax=Biomphalaria glabrata TaxID=6526 RepID=A0A2C9M3R0_BIOGL